MNVKQLTKSIQNVKKKKKRRERQKNQTNKEHHQTKVNKKKCKTRRGYSKIKHQRLNVEDIFRQNYNSRKNLSKRKRREKSV